jgi:hypothetical protein
VLTERILGVWVCICAMRWVGVSHASDVADSCAHGAACKRHSANSVAVMEEGVLSAVSPGLCAGRAGWVAWMVGGGMGQQCGQRAWAAVACGRVLLWHRVKTGA